LTTTEPTEAESGGSSVADDQAEGAPAIAERLQRHVRALDALDGVGLGEHVELYQRAHVELQQALTDIDSA
jgi:hypothetical protein